MSQNICRDYELAEIFRKLRTEKPTVYYTKYNSGHTHKWDKEEGYYEIRQSSFGPIMLWQYLYNEFECVHRIEMKIKNTCPARARLLKNKNTFAQLGQDS